MSRIYFTTPTDGAELRGSERAYMGGLTSDALLWGLGLHSDFRTEEHARQIAQVYSDPDKNPNYLKTSLCVAREGDHFTLNDGRSIGIFSCSLNTLMAVGSDPMILAARLHGQCEIHAYVEGPNRSWLADIIDKGRESGVFRSDQGWEGVLKLLRARDDEPVVTSYSVCDGFPNSYVAEEAGLWSPPEDYDGEPHDAWYDLSAEEQWGLAFKGIQKPEYGCELTPERWDFPEMFFGAHPITAHQVAEAAWKKTQA